RFLFLFISRAGQDRQSRIFRKPWIRRRQLAEVKCRLAIRADQPHAPAGRAKSHRLDFGRRHGVLGKVSTGFCGKKSKGRMTNSCHITGITGQSSARGMWWKPMVYQATISVFSIGRLAFVQTARPSSPLLAVG